MRVIGVTGAVGSGKSRVLEEIEKEYGCPVIRADELARTVQEKGGRRHEAVRLILGDECFDQDGRLDRKRTAEKIFSDKDLLGRINETVWPGVMEAAGELISEYEEQGRDTVFLESALIFDSDLKDMCTEVWYVHLDEEERMRRLEKGRGYSREKTGSIREKQLSDLEFSARSDRVIDNSGSLEDTMEQVRRIWQQKNMQDNLYSDWT